MDKLYYARLLLQYLRHVLKIQNNSNITYYLNTSSNHFLFFALFIYRCLGDLVVWNRTNENDHLLASIGSMHSGHKDCINQISWIRDSLESNLQNLTSEKISRYTTTYRLLSSGSDGRIVCWRIDLCHLGNVNCVKM